MTLLYIGCVSCLHRFVWILQQVVCTTFVLDRTQLVSKVRSLFYFMMTPINIEAYNVIESPLKMSKLHRVSQRKLWKRFQVLCKSFHSFNCVVFILIVYISVCVYLHSCVVSWWRSWCLDEKCSNFVSDTVVCNFTRDTQNQQ